ncbi:consortin-like [Arapaima gigas]
MNRLQARARDLKEFPEEVGRLQLHGHLPGILMDDEEHQNNEEVVQALDAPVTPSINTNLALNLQDLEGNGNQPQKALLKLGLQQGLMRGKHEDEGELRDDGQIRTIFVRTLKGEWELRKSFHLLKGSASGSSTSRLPPCDSSPPTTSSSFSEPSSTLLASLKELGELSDYSDHSLLPQALHRIAEAYFLEEDYERAVQFLQLERLYHERLLSNLATLQEKWEGRCSSNIQHSSSPMGLEQIEALRHICRTHQRKLSCIMVLLCIAGNIADNQRMDHLVLETGDQVINKAEEKDPLIPSSKGEVSPHPYSSPEQLTVTSTSALGGAGEAHLGLTKSHIEGFTGDLLTGSCLQKGEQVRQVDHEGGTLPSTSWAPKTDLCVKVGGSRPECLCRHGLSAPSVTGNEAVIDNRDSSDHMTPVGGKSHMTPQSAKPLNVHTEDHPEEAEEEEEEEEAELEEQGLADGEVGEEALECDQGEDKPSVEMDPAGVRLESLDDLARRIQVEEITPADGLVSILKRRVSYNGDTSAEGTTPKQTPKRRVHFSEPDDGLDQDEVGGASCLVLLLLCLVTVVISMGGTAVYCFFADEESSVCTDFSHNMDFYLGHLQRGVDELNRWFSPTSNKDTI